MEGRTLNGAYFTRTKAVVSGDCEVKKGKEDSRCSALAK